MSVDDKKYLNQRGLRHFWDDIKNKFVEHDGDKVLSDNNYSDADKNKLDGIEEGANKTIVDSTLSDISTNPVQNKVVKDALDDKVTDPNYVHTDNNFTTELKNKYDATADTVDHLTIPTKTSDLVNDSDFVSDPNYVHTDNNFTNSYKTKIDGIESNAEVNIIEDVKVNGTSLQVVSKSVDVHVPTDNVELDNGAGYQTATDVNAIVDSKISSTYKAKGSSTFANLPEPVASKEGYVYNVSDDFTTDSRFVEGAGIDYPAGTNVVIINTTGTTYKYDVLTGVVDLSDYTTFDDFSPVTTQEIDDMMAV